MREANLDELLGVEGAVPVLARGHGRRNRDTGRVDGLKDLINKNRGKIRKERKERSKRKERINKGHRGKDKGLKRRKEKGDKRTWKMPVTLTRRVISRMRTGARRLARSF